jgi:hypothetical protein
MLVLEFFGPDHRSKQIGEEQQSDNADDDSFHRDSKFVAKAHVDGAYEEKQNYESGKDDIVHGECFDAIEGRWLGPS